MNNAFMHTAPPQCYPGHAVVQLEGGLTKTMSELSVGDRVLVGVNTYSEVHFFDLTGVVCSCVNFDGYIETHIDIMHLFAFL